MLRGRRSTTQKSNRIIWGILLFLALLFLISFRGEITGLWKDITRPPQAGPVPTNTPTPTPTVTPSGTVTPKATSTPTPTPAPVAAVGSDVFVIYNCIFGFAGVFFFWLVLVAFQTLLPITNIFEDFFKSLQEVYRAGWHLLLHLIQMHGRAIFVKDGAANTTSEDESREGHGVIVIDYNSAVILEERNLPLGVNGLLVRLWLGLLNLLFLVDRQQSPRVCGPGITFTRPRERIGGVVDLRKQFRLQASVPCYTRDGIELTTNVFAGFTVGQKPDILQVTYEGEERPENLRIVSVEKLPAGHLRIANLQDGLDEADRNEIHAFAQRRRPPGPANGRVDSPVYDHYKDPPNTSIQTFIPDQVYAAFVAKARRTDQKELDWTELPTRVAAGLYRNLLLTVNYDELYALRDENQRFPLPSFKDQLRQDMRNNGILAFRLLLHKDFRRRNVILKRNDIYPRDQLLVTEERSLTNPKVLRDRGIKVIFSGFSDPSPVNPQVYQQRLESWKAAWAQEFEITMAEHELEAARVRSRAYTQAQQDLWRSLSMIFSQQMGEEALALRIFQTLDQAAADEKTQALLPGNAIDMMRHLSGLLLPGDAMRQMIPPPNPHQAGEENR